MSRTQFVILAHGGAGSNPDHADGTRRACDRGLELLEAGQPVLASVCQAVVVLENDPRFNAGVGSRRRSDGSVQMDAACMDSDGQFGAVAVIEGFKNPILIAEVVSRMENHLLAGSGAARFAEAEGFETWNPAAAKSSGGCDTVGCVAFDGARFAASLSTGGTGGARPGRVGDVPLIGCGLYAGAHGAVAATGKGEAITLNLTAFRAHQLLAHGISPESVVATVISWFKDSEDIGLLVVSRNGHATGSNRPMAASLRLGANRS